MLHSFDLNYIFLTFYLKTTWYNHKIHVCALQDENTSLKIQYEQLKAQKDSKEMEAKRFRDLYESEMQWRMRLSEQLLRATDKAYGYKSKLV